MHHQFCLLPPAYVVRREGNSFTLLVCPQGGYPYPIMLCNISQNAMGQPVGEGTLPGPAGGVPARGGYPARGYPVGGYPVGGTLPGGTLPGGTQVRYPPPGPGQDGGYPSWGVPRSGVTPPAGYPPWPGQDGGGGTQLGQHREYLLHGARYASCVHAGGLSCLSSHLVNVCRSNG